MRATLYDFLPRDEDLSNETLLGRFLEYIERVGLELYPSQEAAVLELFEEKNVILNTPTGSGKSLVAAALHFKSLAQGRRSVYTCPVKALVNEKWMNLCREFGPDNVGLSTGDATVNRDAPILCCTAEILANIALREGENAPVREVIMDEFHWYADPERGWAWQVPLLALPQARFLLMSATLGDTRFFEEELTRLNGRPTAAVRSEERPVPLEYEYVETPLAQTVSRLVEEDKAPVYVVHFTQVEAAENAQNFTSINCCSREEKQALAETLGESRFDTPYGPKLRTWLKHGVGLHHAGLLPRYRVLTEQLAQRGLLKIICGTDTLGVGVNIPIRTVLFTRLCKYDGHKTRILSARDFHQISGRAGRKGFDEKGWVVVQAPEHVIENLQLQKKAAATGKKFVKRRPPKRGFINWDRKTFERLVHAPPERLASQFQITHGMLLHTLSRKGNGCEAMRQIIRRCHDAPSAKKRHFRRAWQLFRSLLDRGIVEIVPRTEEGGYIRVNVELQEDFSMDQTLSLYLLETIPLLDAQDPDYALNLLSLVEAILEDPDYILRRQLEKLKARVLAELKAQGAEYMERVQELDKLEHPKPLRDFIYSTFNAFAERHPWVGQENIRPKSIAREMYENLRSFEDYVRDYNLQRVEGLLLRHLNSVHKVLCQTVPDTAKTPEAREMELYFRLMIRQVDSSLLEEWERMRDPRYLPRDARARAQARVPVFEETAGDVTKNREVFEALVRNRIFEFLRSLARSRFEEALQALDLRESGEGAPWTPELLRERMEHYLAERERLLLDPEARSRKHTYVRPSEEVREWVVQQMLVDPEGINDWVAEFRVDLEASRREQRPVTQLLRLGPLA